MTPFHFHDKDIHVSHVLKVGRVRIVAFQHRHCTRLQKENERTQLSMARYIKLTL
jgi:hypothetical protein